MRRNRMSSFIAFDQSSSIIWRDQATFPDHPLMRRRRSHCRRRMVLLPNSWQSKLPGSFRPASWIQPAIFWRRRLAAPSMNARPSLGSARVSQLQFPIHRRSLYAADIHAPQRRAESSRTTLACARGSQPDVLVLSGWQPVPVAGQRSAGPRQHARWRWLVRFRA